MTISGVNHEWWNHKTRIKLLNIIYDPAVKAVTTTPIHQFISICKLLHVQQLIVPYLRSYLWTPDKSLLLQSLVSQLRCCLYSEYFLHVIQRENVQKMSYLRC